MLLSPSSKGAAASQRSTVFRQPHADAPATITSQPWRRAGLGSLEALSPSFTAPKSLKRSPSIVSFRGRRKLMPMRQHPHLSLALVHSRGIDLHSGSMIAPIRYVEIGRCRSIIPQWTPVIGSSGRYPFIRPRSRAGFCNNSSYTSSDSYAIASV
jgi:hypothetical protein